KQVLVKLSGSFPDGAENFLLYLDPNCPMAVVMVVVKDNRPSRRMQVVLAGEYSRPVNIQPLLEGDPFEGKTATESRAEEAGKLRGDEGELVETRQEEEPRQGENLLVTGWRSFFSASLAILLLPVSLFLVTLRRDPVLIQFLVFLVTLSVGFSLGIWGMIPVSSWSGKLLVVALGLLSLEALFAERVRWWRYVLVAFGGVMGGIGLVRGEAAMRFVSTTELPVAEEIINLSAGIQAGVIALSLILYFLFLLVSRFQWYRKSVVQPLAVVLLAYSLVSLFL
ncbi:MAG: hypothetical protein AAGC68_17530, partial [Verrucomicrobiota bacterium]